MVAQICVEMLDPIKALLMHLSASNGKYSVKNTTEADRKASYGMRANNDPSEGNFGVFSDAFEECKGADLSSSAGRGQTRFNRDFVQGAEGLVSGKRSKLERDGKEVEEQTVGLFHDL